MLKLRSPAKINLFLRILRKREDGYHAFASLMQTISLFDELQISIAQQEELTCDDPRLPTDGKNLILKAAELFRKKTGLSTQFKVHLTKKIPIEAGLGGGSGNAATALWGYNVLCGSPATSEQLMEWAAEIGSDIPFFFSSGTAYCTGRGEIVQSLPPLRSRSVWLFKPPEGLSTKLVYGQLNATALPQRNPEEVMKGFLQGKEEFFNDLEVPAFSLLPKLAGIKKECLEKGFSHALLCGSGTSLFCLGNSSTRPMEDVQVFQTHFIQRSPQEWF